MNIRAFNCFYIKHRVSIYTWCDLLVVVTDVEKAEVRSEQGERLLLNNDIAGENDGIFAMEIAAERMAKVIMNIIKI